MKILFAYYADSGQSEASYREIAKCAPAGLEVSCFNVWLPLRKSKLDWERLDRLWQRRDPVLMSLYRDLEVAAQDCDVLIVYNGRNVHPEFVASLGTFNVFSCFDDPESSAKLSYPVAPAFDAVFYGNIASGFQYESWGCERRAFVPIFTAPSEIPKKEEEEQVLSSPRTNDIVLVCGRNDKRRRRMDMLARPFPQAAVYGKNWNRGWIDDQSLDELYRHSKIGWNIHNSTGPINKRLFALAAYGVLPICDNKVGLAEIFQLGKEAVGADTIPEMIDLTRYYLVHEEERGQIAAAAYRRFWDEYHATAIWGRIKSQLEEWGAGSKAKAAIKFSSLGVEKKRDRAGYIMNRLAAFGGKFKNKVGQVRNRRIGDVSAWYDERPYLGEVAPFEENNGAVRYRRPASLGDQYAYQSSAHVGARAWVLASLVHDAKKILLEGGMADTLGDLAVLKCGQSVDISLPGDVGPEAAADKGAEGSEKYDVILNADLVGEEKVLRQALERWRLIASSVVCCCDFGGVGGINERNLRLRDISQMLSQLSADYYYYYMPDIYVPWVEPVTRNAGGDIVIMEIKF